MEGRDVANVRFGQAVARARKRSGKTQIALARGLGCSKGHISHIECGYRRLAQVSVPEVDRELQAEGRLVRLYEELYEPHQIDWLDRLHDLQLTASLIREYHPNVFPGVLQTPEYAQAVIHASAPWLSGAEVDELVTVRLGRSKELLSKEAPRYHVVVDDTVINRPVAPPEVLRDQFAHLLELTETRRIMFQAYEWGQLPHLGLGGPFSLLLSVGAPEMLHVESVYLGQTTDQPEAVRQYGMLFSELQAAARSPRMTVDLLKQLIEEQG